MQATDGKSPRFISSEETTRAVLEYAEVARESSEGLDTTLDFSIESLPRVDRLIETYFSEGPVLQGTVYAYAAYVGECVRRALSGKWGMIGSELALAIGETKTACCFPIRWLDKCFSGSASVVAQFQALIRELNAQGIPTPAFTLSADPPAPSHSVNASNAAAVAGSNGDERDAALAQLLTEDGHEGTAADPEPDLDAANLSLAPFLAMAVVRILGGAIGREQLDAFFARVHSSQGSPVAQIAELSRSVLLNAEAGVNIATSLDPEALKHALLRIPELLGSRYPTEKQAVLDWLLELARTLDRSESRQGVKALESLFAARREN